MLVKLEIPEKKLVLCLAYATTDNFTGGYIYKANLKETLIHEKALSQFSYAVEQASQLGLHFKIWDAFRPLEAQQKLWNNTSDDRYISHPEHGVRPHCRGVALDLTLVNEYGEELPMGTGFDDFSEKAHQRCMSISVEAQANRMLLVGIMHTSGFVCNPFEWWHFQLEELSSYPILSNQDAPWAMI